MAQSITKARIANAPASVYYLPDYITPAEEQVLIDKVLSAPKPKWVNLKNRRFQESGVFDDLDTIHQAPNHCLVNEYLAGQGIMPHKDGPAYLPTVATVSLSSHCVLEFYKVSEAKEGDTSEQVMLSSSIVDEKSSQKPEFSLLVQPRSLLVLKEDVYNTYMHGIREATLDDLRESNILNLTEALPEGLNDNNALLERGTRISLTFRIVQKTISAKKIFLRK
ncbi:Alpha-ketoglutarate-dependent dioxygenase alkB 6 [Entomortierella lignicola]|nr:Alpha-ketoglutarate-dependent dioxygenase alkB 6 [Entomortierella lignicola]